MAGVTARIEAFHAGRDPERLGLKYAAMREDVFRFLRGTCHLFYEDLKPSDLPETPLVWCCGDLHLNNFGTYKGDNRLTYFDVNDFDEACLAPSGWDLARFLTSVACLGDVLGFDRRTVRMLSRGFVDSYRETLGSGKARWLERATAHGAIRELLSQVKKRARRKFLASRTRLAKGERRLVIDGRRTLALQRGEREKLAEFLQRFAAREENPKFFRMLDAARRIAGIGSLGLERWVLLVEGRGSPDGNFLLDLKHQPGSCVAKLKAGPQPQWRSEAERVVVTQRDAQAVPPALLHAVRLGGKPFVLRELMPTTDQLDLTQWRNGPEALMEAIALMGRITAWDALRIGARRGSAGAEELMDFGKRQNWAGRLIEYAGECAERTRCQWREFAAPHFGGEPLARETRVQ